jgi:polyhydroxybutyrate depolymerase
MRLLGLVFVVFAATLLLTACGKVRERREARQTAEAATSTVEAQAGAPSAPIGPTAAPVDPTATVADPPATAPTQPPAPPETCGTSGEAGAFIQTLDSDGITRSYRLYVPASYDSSVPTPLVLNFHGYASNALQQERYSSIKDAADQYGFIAASPDGTGQPQEWYLYGPVEQGYVDDFAFVDRLIDDLEARYCVDPARIYATGISNGGGMTSLVGCELNGRVAAISPVAGEPFVEARCAGKGPMPIVAFHGTDDALVPFEAGVDTARLDIFNAGARNNMLQWAQHNGCNLTLHTQRIADDVVLESYTGCDADADVQLYVVEGGGHTWPGARDVNLLGTTTHSIDATQIVWQFFAAHPK